MILLGSLLTVGVCGFAIWRGDTPARLTGIVVLVVLVGSLIGQAVFGWTNTWPVVGADVCLGLALIVLATLHPRRWLYVELGFCGGLVLVHSLLLESDARITPLHRALVDSLNVGMLATLLAGTLRRRRAPG